MKNPTAPKAFWALLWRSAVYLPWALVLLLFSCGAWAGLLALPFTTVLLALNGDWPLAGGAVVAWVLLILLTPTKVWKWLKVEDKDCLNSQENV
jgi:hypothetical protein